MRNRKQRGSTVIETALVLTTLAVLLVGAMDVAQFLFVHSLLTERVRTAARYGALHGVSDTDSIRNMVLYDSPSAPANGSAGAFGMQADSVAIDTPGKGTEDARLVVTIAKPPYKLNFPLAAGSIAPGIMVTVPISAN